MQITITTTISVSTREIAQAADHEEMFDLLFEISRALARFGDEERGELSDRIRSEPLALDSLRLILAGAE